MAKDEITQADVNLAILQTLKDLKAQQSGGADIGAALERITDTLAGVANRTRPENPEHNRISWNNPAGLKESERPQLKCKFFWVGAPLELHLLDDREINALNLLEVGDYRVTKANGNTIPFTVSAKKSDSGKLMEMSVQFPCNGDQSSDHRSMVAYIHEAMGQAVPTLDDLMRQVDALMRENRVLKTVVEAA